MRAHRLKLGLSLSDLAERSGVSVSNISKIETGKIIGGFETVYRICRGLGILVTDLLEEQEPPGGDLRVLRQDEVEVQETRLYDYVPLATRPGGRLNAAIMVIHSREVPPLVDWSNHGGEEMVTVLSGQVALYYRDQEPVILGPGDSANFNSGPRHCYVCLSEEPARLLFVSTRPLSEQEENSAASGFSNMKNLD